MTSKDELLSTLLEIKNSILNDNFSAGRVKSILEQADMYRKDSSLTVPSEKSNLIRSFLITFNVNNFSDLCVLLLHRPDGTRIIEHAGNEMILGEFKNLVETDPGFYRDIDRIKVRENSYRMFYESMENNNGVYTLLAVTESSFFIPTRFHMLCDIIMDIVRSADVSQGSVYNDLFEDLVVDITGYFSTHCIAESELYLFKFENIFDFFLKMGLEIIIELSETIKKKLTEVFGESSAVFRFSLSEYIVFAANGLPAGLKESDLNNSSKLDFVYKGIVLKHRCIGIPYSCDQSVYSVFEKIFLIESNML